MISVTPGWIFSFSIITQVIIEILVLSLAENGVIFRYNHLRQGDYSERTNFQMAASSFVVVSDEEINLSKKMPFRGIPNMPQSSECPSSKVRCENCGKCN